MHLQPILWLNLLVGLPVLGYTVYIFYTGVPEMMEIPEERGFLFSSAVMAFGLVALVALLAISVLLWSSGFGPSFWPRASREHTPMNDTAHPRSFEREDRRAGAMTEVRRGSMHRHARDLQLHRRAPVRGDDHRVGDRGHAGRGGDRGPARVARAQLRHPLAHLRPAPPPAHQRGDLRVRRLRALRDLVLRGAAHLPRAAVLPPPRRVHLLGLAGGDRARRDHPPPRHHPGQGVRGARVADRRPHRGGVGGLRDRLHRHHRDSAGSATSTWRTGSSPPSSSPSRCCTSSTAR